MFVVAPSGLSRGHRRLCGVCLAAILAVACGTWNSVGTVRVTIQADPRWSTTAVAPRTLTDVDHVEIRLVGDLGWPTGPYAAAPGTSAKLRLQGSSAQMLFDQVPPGTYRVAVRAFADGAETQNITRVSADWGGQLAVSAASVTVSVGAPVRYSAGDHLAVTLGLLDGIGDKLDVGVGLSDGNPLPPITVEVLAS